MGASSATAGVTAKATSVSFQCRKSVLEPGLPDLFEAVVVISAAAHPIKILWNNRVIGIRQRKPIQRLVAVVTRRRSNSETHTKIYGVRSRIAPFPVVLPQ